MKRQKHRSIAMKVVQEKRNNVTLSNGKELHDYANLYFHARNPMMYSRKEEYLKLCVLRIKAHILDVQGVMISDRNASSQYALILPMPKGLEAVDEKLTFARDWTDLDPIHYFHKKSAKCAEVLVPEHIPPVWLMGAYLSCKESLETVTALDLGLELTMNPGLFFH
jgi:hypothetical protein